MTHFLVSDTNPKGFKLEEILGAIRKDILIRCNKIVDDHRAEARHVLENNMRILTLVSEAIRLAEDSTATLNKSFGPGDDPAAPRIGVP